MIRKKNSSVVIVALLVLIFTLSYFFYKKSTHLDYSYSQYEKELLDHFKEIALKTEFGDNKGRIVKWEKAMYLCPLLYGESIKLGQCKEQLQTLRKIIHDINNLVNDNFKIILTEDINKSNAIISFTSLEKMNQIDPNFFVGVEEKVAGLTKGYWKNYSLYKVEVFIDINESLEVQKSAITEEICQSIGLSNDTKKYSNSIFYQNKSSDGIFISELSSLDKDIIQLLYNPSIKAGMDAKQAESEMEKVLKEGDLKLYGTKAER